MIAIAAAVIELAVVGVAIVLTHKPPPRSADHHDETQLLLRKHVRTHERVRAKSQGMK